MKPIDLTAARALGYTEREARFLALVVLHSGHFLRRQFRTFAGVGGFGRSSAFIDKCTGGAVRSWTHVRPHRYQVISQEIYECFGVSAESDRKPCSLDHSTRRILGLDFVLAHPDHEYLTQSDRPAFFRSLGVPDHRLPTLVFGGRGNRGGTARLFPDRFPIYVVRDASGVPSEVVLTYVSDEHSAVAKFRGFLRRYRPLLTSLPCPSRLVLVASSNRLFTRAAREFASSFGAGSALVTPSMKRYFEARRAYESGAFSTLRSEDYVTIAEGEKRFREPQHDALYREWCSGQGGSVAASESRFETFLAGSTGELDSVYTDPGDDPVADPAHASPIRPEMKNLAVQKMAEKKTPRPGLCP